MESLGAPDRVGVVASCMTILANFIKFSFDKSGEKRTATNCSVVKAFAFVDLAKKRFGQQAFWETFSSIPDHQAIHNG